MCPQAQRLLLQDGSLAHFTVQSSSALPTITLGLPANARVSISHNFMKMTVKCYEFEVLLLLLYCDRDVVK